MTQDKTVVDIRAFGKWGYPCLPRERSFDKAEHPIVGDWLFCWRPWSHDVQKVEHVYIENGVAWVWFKDDNRWFPDHIAYPNAKYCWTKKDTI